MELPEITMFEHGIIQVKIAMSYPLRWVNSYIIVGDRTWSVIDPGPRSEENEAAWQKVWGTLELDVAQLESIILTHHHPDHYGLAGWLQAQSDAPVYMSARSLAEARLSWGEGNTAAYDLIDFYTVNGMSNEITDQLPEHLQSFVAQVLPQPQVSIITPEQPFKISGHWWIPIQTSGHAAGHLSFYQADWKLMICGDAVLPQISPNISLIPNSDPEPLQSYLDGLRILGEYEVEWAYPGHRRPFTGFRERTIKLLDHHEQRLDAMTERIRIQPLNGYDVCMSIFNSKLTLHQLRFAMSETLAHLEELIRRDRAHKYQQDGIWIYTAHE